MKLLQFVKCSKCEHDVNPNEETSWLGGERQMPSTSSRKLVKSLSCLKLVANENDEFLENRNNSNTICIGIDYAFEKVNFDV